MSQNGNPIEEAVNKEIRNVAIIAHVDHGKTTLVDALLQQTGTFGDREKVVDRAMDSNDLERERGITILAKNTSLFYKGVKINIIDTPGHADFGAEVERILCMVDGVVLLVDAAEGPRPQTKFVLSKALELGLSPILLVNKVDRFDARIDEVVNEAFDLFVNLEANEKQLDFPILYSVGRDGWVSSSATEKGTDCSPLLDMILEYVPPPKAVLDAPFTFLVSMLDRDPYVGRIAIGRVMSGIATKGQIVKCLTREGIEVQRGKIGKLYAFAGLKRVELNEAKAGDIVALAGLDIVTVSNTLCSIEVEEALPAPMIDPPTLMMTFSPNDSPLVGQEGTLVTSADIRDRLVREAEVNVGLRIEFGDGEDAFKVMGRGELHLSIIIEQMRREGFELLVSRPEILFREENGVKTEPFEEVVIDVDSEFSGSVMEKMGERRFELKDMNPDFRGKQRLFFEGPLRGLIGYRNEFLTDTKGTGVFTSIFKGYKPCRDARIRRKNGVLVSMCDGISSAYSINLLQDRGKFFIEPGVVVYDGMIVGENSKSGDLEVNVVKAKQLTNMRAAGKDEAPRLIPVRPMTLEVALTYIETDELIEVTPQSIRLRKKGLNSVARKRYKD